MLMTNRLFFTDDMEVIPDVAVMPPVCDDDPINLDNDVLFGVVVDMNWLFFPLLFFYDAAMEFVLRDDDVVVPLV